MRRSIPLSRPSRPTAAALAFALASASALVAPATSMAASPIDGGAITIFPVQIDTGTGDQYDPHVNGDLVSYTSDARIRLYDFFSGNDSAMPAPPATTDLLSDVSGGQVVFTRIEASGQTPVLAYDTGTATTTPVDPVAIEQQYDPAIGGSTVAFIDVNGSFGEVVIATLGGPAVQVTSDTRTDQSPSVAPSGDLVVYESCAPDCDIHQAARKGTAWVVTDITTTDENEHNPDTDGSLIVYDAVPSGEQDIAWQAVGGGPEQRLELPGLQRDPRVRAGVISFESIPLGSDHADLYLYQVATNRLFRVTTTPDDDSLNDLDVLADGRIRLVWSSGETGQRDVYGATIELPPAGPTYTFGGFRRPVDALPTLNQMKAGGAVPVKFSLGGDQGPSIFAAGSPKSQAIACDSTATVDGVEQTVSAGGSSLTYDPLADTYSYVWKTDKAWAGTCRQLVLTFVDGSVQRANFTFK